MIYKLMLIFKNISFVIFLFLSLPLQNERCELGEKNKEKEWVGGVPFKSKIKNYIKNEYLTPTD